MAVFMVSLQYNHCHAVCVCVTDVLLDENAIISHLFTLGEIAQLCPGLMPSRVFMLVESLVAAPTITSVGQFTQLTYTSTRPSSCRVRLVSAGNSTRLQIR